MQKLDGVNENEVEPIISGKWMQYANIVKQSILQLKNPKMVNFRIAFFIILKLTMNS